MSQGNTNLNINNDQLLLINILNTMYNDNLRQINSLTNSNNEIRNLITRLLNTQTRNRTYYNTNVNNRGRRYDYTNIRSNSQSQTNNQNAYSSAFILDYIIPQRSNVENDSFSRILQRFFEPIEVYPTSSQIEAATRIVRYSDIVTPRNRACPISLENFNDTDIVSVIRFCGHVFNTEQLNIWFRTNCRCPVCRYDIRNFNANNFSENNETMNNNETQNETTTTENNSSTINTNTERTNTNTERTNNNLNNIYYTLLNSGTENLINLILDPSGNNIDGSTNLLFNILNNTRR